VQHGINHDRIANHAENDSIGKPARIGPAHLQSASADTVEQRIAWQTCQLGADGIKKLAAKPGLLLFMPRFSLEEVGIHFGADGEAIFHSPNLRFKRASNSSQGIALAGSFS